MDVKKDPYRLKRWLRLLGATNLSLLLLKAVLSYCLVPVGPFGVEQPNEALVLASIARLLQFRGLPVQDLLIGHSVFQDPYIFGTAALLPSLLTTIVFIATLLVLIRYRDEIVGDVTRTLFYWSVGFFLVSIAALPFLAHDFWLSIGWGRMTANGLNPYYVDLSSEFVLGLPLDVNDNLRMTYGPLWTLISGVLTWISGDSVIIAALMFKIMLVGAGIGSLFLVWKMLGRYSLSRQCVGLTIFGWLPLSISEISAEGHNDILMVFLLLLWLYFLEQNRIVEATLALSASVLIKYTTAPLFLVEILYLSNVQRFFIKEYLVSILSSGALVAVVFGLFYRSPDFFLSAIEMRNWHFYTPQEAVATLSGLVDFPLWLKHLPQAVFMAVTVHSAIAYVRDRTTEKFRHLVLSVMSTVLFATLGHVWPWFLLWVLPVAALVPNSRLARWNIGVALVFPFTILALQYTQAPPFLIWNLAGVTIYAFAFLCLFPVLGRAASTDNDPHVAQT